MCLCLTRLVSSHILPGGPSLSCFDFSPFLCRRCQAKQVGEIRVEIPVQTPDTQAVHVWYTLHTQVKRYIRPICCRAFTRVSTLCTLCNLSLRFHSVSRTEIHSVRDDDDVMPEFATHLSVVDFFCFCTACIQIWCSPLFFFLRMFDQRWPLFRRCAVRCRVPNKSPLWKLNIMVCRCVTFQKWIRSRSFHGTFGLIKVHWHRSSSDWKVSVYCTAKRIH